MGVRENLIAAKALIDTPEKWGKGNGHFLFARVPKERNCAITALAQAAIDRGADTYGSELDAIEAFLPEGVTLWAFNDRPKTTHADIMALFDRAIAASEPSP